MELTKDIHHEIYNYEIINNSDTTCVFFSEKKHESFSSYKEMVAAAMQNNIHNFKSKYFATVYYKDKDGVCDWLKPVDVIVDIYLSGRWATTKYLKRICEKWHLDINDFELGYNDFGEIYYKYSNKNLKF